MNYLKNTIRYVVNLYHTVDRRIFNLNNTYYRLSGYSYNKDLIYKILTTSVKSITILSITTAILVVLNLHSLIIFPIIALTANGLLLSSTIIYVLHLVNVRRKVFDEKFMYTLSYMIPMISANIPLIEILRTVYRTERDRIIKREFGLIIRDVVEGGYDVLSSIRNSIERVPSTIYRDVMNLILEGYKLTSELGSVLLTKLEALIRSKTIRLRQLITSMTLLFQMYVVLAFLLPVLVVIIAISLSPLGPLSLGFIQLDAAALMILLTIIYSPIIAYTFYIIFDTVLAYV
ncbi:MAG: hypothetical protein B6V02_02185 [Thermoprotei archaeon ex4572_64]|nr:MAG: hypothetical protein B6V02_02185 [Thermoprotei archaeon ex4572_64]